jgi:hypothetical protein
MRNGEQLLQHHSSYDQMALLRLHDLPEESDMSSSLQTENNYMAVQQASSEVEESKQETANLEEIFKCFICFNKV